jgi:hypothetical protein
MQTEQWTWTPDGSWKGQALLGNDAQLVLAFGGIDEIPRPFVFDHLRKTYPKADIVCASTAGEIVGSNVLDGTICATAIFLEKTPHRCVVLDVPDYKDSFACGAAIRKALYSEDLRHILLISDGSLVNGDQLSEGINKDLPTHIVVTGGLAADAGRFNRTFVGFNETARTGRLVAIGFYGPHILVSHGSKGGWDEFGPIRKVTQSAGNVLFSLDGVNALEIYKKYLGPKASELPGAALLFPLCLLRPDGSQLVRTILSIDEEKGSMTFAGDIPQGAAVQFMMANFDRLVDGATRAAEENTALLGTTTPELVLMISCVGRKIVLAQRVEEEVEAVHELFGNGPSYCGFYSNGEISPITEGVGCSLHNQTMTITTYSER